MAIIRKNPTLIFIACLLISMLSLTSIVVAQDDDGETTPEPDVTEATAEAPTPIVIDYEVPVDPNVDLSIVVARIGDLELTVEDFQKYSRFERYRQLYILDSFVNSQIEAGVANPVDLDDPNNPVGGSIATFLQQYGDVNASAAFAYQGMLISEFYWQEAEARGLSLSTCDENTIWSNVLAVQLFDCETITEDFVNAQAIFLAGASAYSGMTSEEVNHAVLGFVIGDTVAEAIGEESEVAIYNTRHIRVADAEAADAIYQRLADGEAFYDVLVDVSGEDARLGNGGELPPVANNGQLVQAFADALFANDIGIVPEPIQTDFGWHVIEVLEQFNGRRVRHILLPNENDANSAIEQINEGVDFVELVVAYSQDQTSVAAGGELGIVTSGNTSLPQAFRDAVFAAEGVGLVNEPIETERGWHVVEILEEVPAVEVSSRHILVETEEDALAALERINAGEDFAYVSNDISLDFSMGPRGFTMIELGGQPQTPPTAFYSLAELGAVEPQLADAMREQELSPGDVLEPIETVRGFYVLVVLDEGSRLATPTELQNIMFEWQDERFESDYVMQTQLWRYYAVADPFPSDINPAYAELDVFVEDGIAQAQVEYEENLIPNFLQNLQAPDVPVDETSESED